MNKDRNRAEGGMQSGKEKMGLESAFWRVASSSVMVILAVVIAAMVVTSGFRGIQEEIREHVQLSLYDVTRQYAVAVRTELRAKTNLLRGVAVRMPEELDGIQKNLEQFDQMRQLYHFTRVGYITLDGMAYASDGSQTDLSGTELWGLADHRNAAISPLMEDPFSRETEMVNLLTVPMFDEGNRIRGYLFAVYTGDLMWELLTIDSFEGRGDSYILLPTGEIVTGPDLNRQDSILDLLEARESNAAAAEELRVDLALGNSGFLTYMTTEAHYMYYMPFEVLDGELELYLATVVPVRVLDDRTAPILNIARWLLITVVACIVVFLIFCMLSYQTQNRRLMTLAFIDPMTGRDNYSAFRWKMRNRKAPGYIVSLDLVGFKIINNVCGVPVGDRLILEIWKQLEKMLKPGELACHISGDQYVMFLTDQKKEAVIRRITQCHHGLCRLSDLMEIPKIVPRFGIYSTDNSAKVEDGYGKANLAKKTLGTHQDRFYAIYDDELRQQIILEKLMEDAFETAIATREFHVWYQPKFSPTDGKMVGAEALSRWVRSTCNQYKPSQFVPLFERNGMIARLDEYVFARVCETQRDWIERGLPAVPVSVNISRASLYYTGIVDRYRQIIRKNSLEPWMVPLEITESAVIDNAAAQERIRAFWEAGFQIQLDDFGSGYSALSTLNTQCFTVVKLDKSLVDGLDGDHGRSLVYYVINLAHGLGLSVTAEGVEKQSQVDNLANLGCDELQGYYYSRPCPLDEFEKLLDKRE